MWRGNTSCDFLLSLYLSTELCGVGTHRVIFFFLFIYPQNCAAWEHNIWFSSFSLFVHRTVWRGKTSCDFLFLFIFQQKPGAVARSDARSPGMRTVAGSILRSDKTFFRENLVMKKNLRPFSPFRLFKKDSCQLLAKVLECALIYGNLLGGFPGNSVDRLTDHARNDLKKCRRAVKHQLNNKNNYEGWSINSRNLRIRWSICNVSQSKYNQFVKQYSSFKMIIFR